MPRYYRRRATRVIKPKKKWATNLVSLSPVPVVDTNTAVFYYQLAVNANPTNIPTPVIVKTGNFKLQCDATFELTGSSQVEFSAYIVYVPEGMATNLVTYAAVEAFVTRHPEWIMCWKYGSFDFIGTRGNVDSIKVSSRLKRNLNSGDAIYYFALARTATGVGFNQAASGGKCQYWTCAN